MSKKSYLIGAFLGRHKFIVAGGVAALVIYCMWPAPVLAPPEAIAAARRIAAENAQKIPVVAAPAPNPCDTGSDTRLTKAQAFLEAGDPDSAFDVLQPCRSTLSAEGKVLMGKALTQSSVKREKVAAAEAKRIRAEKKRSGVSVGMSEQDALDSNWGKPRKVNRTTNAYGVSEQWVYDGGYLYFRDGVLTSIQN